MAEQFSSFLVSEDTGTQDRVVVYGMELLLSTVIDFMLIFTVSLLFHRAKEMLFFLLFFCPLRQTVGGNHGKSYLSCTLTMLVYTVLLMCIWTFLPFNLPIVFMWCVLIISIVTVSLLAPVEDANKKLGNKRRSKLRIASISIILLDLLLFILLNDSIKVIICYVLMTQEILLVTGFAKNKLRGGQLHEEIS